MFAKVAGLSLASLMLVGSAGVLAGAGPRDDDAKLRVQLSFGDRERGSWGWGRERFERRPAPAPVRYEMEPRSVSFEAFQAGDTITFLARGENPYLGFTTSIERGPRGVLILRNFAPINCAPNAQACAPFSLAGSVISRTCLSELKVIVAGKEYCVPVTQVSEIARTW
jgi:hypothetical protein